MESFFKSETFHPFFELYNTENLNKF